MEQISGGGELTPSEDITIGKEECSCGGPIDITVIDGVKSAPQAYQYVDTSISDLCKKMNVDNIIL